MKAAQKLDPHLWFEATLLDAEIHPVATGLVAVVTAPAPYKVTSTEKNKDKNKEKDREKDREKASDRSDGKSKPDQNEDSCAIIPYDDDSGVLVVADGCGGLPGGQQASQIAIKTIKQALAHGQKHQLSIREAILDGIEKANKQVCELAMGAATTLLVAEIQGSEVRTYHVGDSQAIVVGSRGKIKHLTTAHSPVGYAVEAGLLDAEEALHHEERHLVSNILGDPNMHIEVGSAIRLHNRDTLILASDGLFDNLTPEEISSLCRKSQLLTVVSELTELSRSRMTTPEENKPSKPDDLTILAFRPLLEAST